jgi:citrate/tricarballylate utilization protein
MRATETVAEARREIEICNACRYCETYCAVFPAMTLQRAFTDEDLGYFANLCHNCKGCFQACQYAPPHEFGVNIPKTFAELRQETYEEYAWPPGAGALFRRTGTLLALVAAVSIAFVLIATMALRPAGVLYAPQIGPGAFYAIIPWGVMVAFAGATFLYAILAMAIGAANFWRDTRSDLSGPLTLRALARGLHDAASLRYLGNDGNGCNDFDDRYAQVRRRLHHAMAYGFLFCFAATCVATVYDHFLGLPAPYPVLSWPVMLGLIGGVGLVVGTAGLIWIKIVTDPAPVARSVMGGEYALLILLFLAAATGLLLLGLRETGAMGVLLAVHLGIILALFLALPYSKFVHAVYRSAALVKAAIERDINKPLGE